MEPIGRLGARDAAPQGRSELEGDESADTPIQSSDTLRYANEISSIHRHYRLYYHIMEDIVPLRVEDGEVDTHLYETSAESGD